MNRALERKNGYWNKGPDIRGDLSGITGNLYGITGNLSGIRGNLDECEITDEERERGIDISELIKEARA